MWPTFDATDWCTVAAFVVVVCGTPIGVLFAAYHTLRAGPDEFVVAAHELHAHQPLPVPSRKIDLLARSGDWPSLQQKLDHAHRKYVIVNAKNGLGNRLRALASAMAVAAAHGRPLLLIWVPDEHCHCTFVSLFRRRSLPFAVLDVEVAASALADRPKFQVLNYMRGEPGAVKDAPLELDPRRHLYFRSAYVLNHTLGGWAHAQFYLQQLRPVAEVERLLVANRSMVGLHVRNLFDAPRLGLHVSSRSYAATTTARPLARSAAPAVASGPLANSSAGPSSRSSAAGANRTTSLSDDGARLEQLDLAAKKEYGAAEYQAILTWRRAGHWSNFVGRMQQMLREHAAKTPPPREPLLFYLAADSEEAYTGLLQRFPKSLVVTRRACDAQRCDFRDCSNMIYSLVDMLNLARTSLILGSGHSSYSEVAARFGARPPKEGHPVHFGIQLEMAGRDFGQLLPSTNRQPTPTGARPTEACPSWEDVFNTPKQTRWQLWEAPAEAPAAQEVLGSTIPHNCSTGCVVKKCRGGLRAPCCVVRQALAWPVPCADLPFGCSFNENNTARFRVVRDYKAVPSSIVPALTCASRQDVLNTDEKMRWRLWSNSTADEDDGAGGRRENATCSSGCSASTWCDAGVRAPCCLKRAHAVWGATTDCRRLPFGCSAPCLPDSSESAMTALLGNRLTAAALPPQMRVLAGTSAPLADWRPPCDSDAFDMAAMEEIETFRWAPMENIQLSEQAPSVEPSDECPTREDVLNTRSALRWPLWDDPTCSDGCQLKGCHRGRSAPCCVKRAAANWSVPCQLLVHGCHHMLSKFAIRGLVVHDKRTERPLTRAAQVLAAVGLGIDVLGVCIGVWPESQALRAFRLLLSTRLSRGARFTLAVLIFGCFFLAWMRSTVRKAVMGV